MSVVIETTIGDITVDLFLEKRPRTCLNFVKLCKLKYYNYNLFHTIQHDFIAQTGDPTGSGHGGTSVWGIIEGRQKRFFEAETAPKIRHSEVGYISMVSSADRMIGSQFFFTLGSDLLSLDEKHCVFGEVVEGIDVLGALNEVICDEKSRPYKDVRITHTVVLDDPFENPRGFREPSRSPSPSAERMKGGRIAADEEIDDTEGKTEQEINEMLQEQEAKARATILEIVGDLPDADMAPPENVLFICKLNPVTSDDDLEIIFSRFGKIKGCEVIRDKQSGDSLQYAFVEFEEQKSCEDAYFKMDNVLIDDRRIHVDFSQSVAKLKWRGKGRGVIDMDERNGNGDSRGGGPRINFNDKNWKKGAPRDRSPARRNNWSPRRDEPRRDYKEGKRWRSPRRNSPPSRRPNVSSSRRSRSPRPLITNRPRGTDRDDQDRGRGRRTDSYSNRSAKDHRSRSRSPRRRSSPAGRPASGAAPPSSWPRRVESSGGRSRGRSSERRSRSREMQRRGARVNDQEVNRRRQSTDRDHQAKRPAVASASSATSESDSSGSSSSTERRRQRKKAAEKKQKRNKTKKSKKSRTSSDDSSSSDESEDARERKKRRKQAKKNKRKHKKSK